MKWKSILATLIVITASAAALGFSFPFWKREQVLTLPGTVETQEVRLSSRVGGRVNRVMVVEGQVVEAGQPLVYLDVAAVKAQLDQVLAQQQTALAELDKAMNGPRTEEKAAAQAAVAAARARLERLKAGPRSEEIDRARSELHSTQADLAHARQDLQRARRLRPGVAIAPTEYDRLSATYDRIQGQASAARARLEQLLAGTRPEEIAEAKAELARLQANYEQLLAGTRSEDLVSARARVAELRARQRELEVDLKEGIVVAPERAVVEVVAVRKGDVVPANQPVARVLRTEDLWVKVFVPETKLGQVRLNQDVEITIDSHPGKRFAGTVMQIASKSEFTPRNVQSADERRHQVFAVKVRISDTQGIFKSGMAAEVHLMLEK